jgi:hypothetical protein
MASDRKLSLQAYDIDRFEESETERIVYVEERTDSGMRQPLLD